MTLQGFSSKQEYSTYQKCLSRVKVGDKLVVYSSSPLISVVRTKLPEKCKFTFDVIYRDLYSPDHIVIGSKLKIPGFWEIKVFHPELASLIDPKFTYAWALSSDINSQDFWRVAKIIKKTINSNVEDNLKL